MTEKGFSLVELLISIFLIAIMSMSVLKNTVSALRASKLTELHHAASTLASARIEELASERVSDLDGSFDETDTVLSWGTVDLDFLRDTTVVVNADESRDVTVTVTVDSTLFPTSVTFETTYAE